MSAHVDMLWAIASQNDAGGRPILIVGTFAHHRKWAWRHLESEYVQGMGLTQPEAKARIDRDKRNPKIRLRAVKVFLSWRNQVAR